MTDVVSKGAAVEAQRSAAQRFARVSQDADRAARSAPRGRRASAFAKVMTENGYPELDMNEVRRIVGE